MTNKSYKCPLCTKKYVEKQSLYNHLDREHKEQLEGLSPAHWYFDWRNKNTTHQGLCTQCRKNPTEFNEITEKYQRFCSQECKKKYAEEFKKRMMNKYGKTTLLNDPEFQKKMLANRKISGTYIWTDGTKFTYTGSYEKDCLAFLDKVMNFDSKDIMFPAPQVFKYMYQNKEHFYIPDGFIVPLNIIMEIKASDNKHYRERDIDIEKTKNKVLLENQERLNYHFIEIFDKNYKPLVELIDEVKNN